MVPVPSFQPRLSLFETLDLVFRLLVIVPTQLSVNALRAIYISHRRRLSYRYFLKCAVKRTFLSRFPSRQLQFMQPTFQQVYKTYISSKLAQAAKTNDSVALERLRPEIEQLDENAAIAWIGDRKRAKKFVLFFHGGGYVCPIQLAHLEWCYQAYVVPGAHRDPSVEVAVAVLQYTLLPAAKYPVQLRQAIVALQRLVFVHEINPADIVIGGDSAGGNLTAQVLSHLLRPRPGVRLVKLDTPLAGAFLVSPWLSARTNTRSFLENRWIDMISPEMMQTVNRMGFSGREFQEEIRAQKGWSMPVDVDGKWLEGLQRVTRSVYITVGGQETFHDHVVDFAERVRVHNEGLDFRLEISEKEGHDFIFLEAEMQTVGEATRRMRTWFTEAISKEPVEA